MEEKIKLINELLQDMREELKEDRERMDMEYILYDKGYIAALKYVLRLMEK